MVPSRINAPAADMASEPVWTLHIVGLIAARYGGPLRNGRDVCAALVARGHRVVALTTYCHGSQRLSERDRRSLTTTHQWAVVPVPTRGPTLSPEFARRAHLWKQFQ